MKHCRKVFVTGLKTEEIAIDFSTCLVCLTEHNSGMYPLESEIFIENSTSTITAIFNSLTKDEIIIHNNLPNQICMDCFQRLINAHLLLKQYEASQKILLNLSTDKRYMSTKPGVIPLDRNIEIVIKSEDSGSYGNSVHLERTKIIKNEIKTVKGTEEPKKIHCNMDLNEEEMILDTIFEDFIKESVVIEDTAIIKSKTLEEIRAKIVEDSIKRKNSNNIMDRTILKCKNCNRLIYSYQKSNHIKYCNNKTYCDNLQIELDLQNISSAENSEGEPVAESVRRIKEGLNKRKRHNQVNKLIVQCSFCHMKLYSTEMEDHKKRCKETFVNMAGQQIFPCDECNKSYILPGSLNMHKKNVHGDKMLCDHCGALVLYNMWKNHQVKHGNIKPYTCELCNMKFYNKGLLQRHIRRHTQERPFKCMLCSKTFGQSGGLAIHKRTHTGIRPFECIVCSKRFITAGNLKVHLKIHENIDGKGARSDKKMEEIMTSVGFL